MRLTNAKDIILHPEDEWFRMQEEEHDRRSLLRYGTMCLAISHGLLLCWILISLANRSMPSVHLLYGPFYWCAALIFRFAIGLIGLVVLPWLLAELAPTFRGARDSLSALRLYIFALTPAWAGMIFGGWGTLSGSIYSIYLIWKYAGQALLIPPLKKVSFVAAVIFVLMIVQWVIYVLALWFSALIVRSA